MVKSKPWKEEGRELEERDFELMSLPIRYRESVWDKVSFGSESSESSVEAYRDKLRGMYEQGTGVYIWGPLGTGKTALGSLMMMDFRSHGQSTIFARADLLMKARFDKTPVNDDNPDLWEYSRHVDVLMIDDFGKSYRDAKGFSDMAFESLFRDRYDNRLVTIITSNISPSNLQDDSDGFAMKPSTISVLMASVVPIKLAGMDHRSNETKRGPL